MATDLIERALERARRGGAEQAEVYLAESSGDSVDFSNNRLADISSSSSRGVGVRVLVGGRIGFSSTSIMDGVGDAVDAALATALLTNAQDRPFTLPGKGSVDTDISDPAVEGITVAELMAMGSTAVERLRPLADGILAGAGAGRSTSQVWIGNSAGLRSSYRKSSWSFFALAQRVEGTSVLWCYDGGASLHRDLDVDAAIEGAAVKVRQSLREGRMPSGPRPVLFTPAGLAALLPALHSAVGAPAVYRRTSPLTGRLGERVLSDLVTIVDDLRPEAGRGGVPFDDEGVPAGPLAIFSSGILQNFIADLRYAARLDLQGGRGRRGGYTGAPSPAAGNWAMAEGKAPLAELLARAEGGLLVDSLLGMHGSNLANGDFSANVGLGFAIGPGGEVQYRVKDAAIAGNVYDLLGDRLLALSSERRRTSSGSDLLPWALMRDVPIT